MLRIVEPGWATTVQDRGRPGYGHLGVPRSGAVDRGRHDLVNRLVGNPPEAATLETAGGLVVEAIEAVLVARSDLGTVETLPAGERLRIGPGDGEVWGYLGVRGGIDVEPVLGSRSTDTLSSIGPKRPTAGDELATGLVLHTEVAAELAPPRRRGSEVRAMDGPQADRVADRRLWAGEWTVLPGSDRIGARLATVGLDAEAFAPSTFEMPSQPLVEGAVQLTPSGEIIVMLADHPTTGGYPVVAVVHPDDVAAIAQTPPGDAIRVRIVPESGTDPDRIASVGRN